MCLIGSSSRSASASSRCGLSVLGLLLVWLGAACDDRPAERAAAETRAEVREAASPVSPQEHKVLLPEPSVREGEGTQPGKAASKLKEQLKKKPDRGPILVGGCGEACGDVTGAFRNFIRSCLLKDPRQPDCVRFIDTAELVYKGEELGRAWVQLYKDGRIADRKADIDLWLQRFEKELGRPIEPTYLLSKLDRALTVKRLSAMDVIISFSMPMTSTIQEGEPWDFHLGRRGLEWLVGGVRPMTGP